MAKICIKCNVSKELDEFDTRPDSVDGYKNICKICRRAYMNEYNKNPPIKTTIEEGMKYCGGCNTIKSKNDFGKKQSNKDGLQSRCKTCKKRNDDVWLVKHPGFFEAYRKSHKEEIKKYNEIYGKENKDIIAVKSKERVENRTEEEKEKIKIRQHNWYINNKDKAYEGKTRRRARAVGVDENYGRKERKITMAAFNYKCYNCNSEEKLCIDHHRPLIKGNALTLNNAVVLCKICNNKKFDKDPEEFYGVEKCAELDKKLSDILKVSIPIK